MRQLMNIVVHQFTKLLKLRVVRNITLMLMFTVLESLSYVLLVGIVPKKVKNEILSYIDDKYPEIARNLFCGMTEKDPQDRFSIYDVFGRLESSEYRKYLSAYKMNAQLKAENEELRAKLKDLMVK